MKSPADPDAGVELPGEPPTKSPDGLSGELSGDRRALASVAVQFFVNGAVFASFIPRLPEIKDRIGVTIDTMGVLIAVAMTVGLLGSMSAARLIERFGTRRVLIVGAALLVGAVPLIGFATVPVVFVIGVATMAVLDVIVDVAMNLQGSWLSARRHAPVMNRLHGLWSLGTVVGGVAASRAASAGLSLQVHLVSVSIVLMATLVFVARGLLRSDQHASRRDDEGDEAAPTQQSGRSASRFGLLAFAMAGGFAITVEIVSSDWAAFRLSEDFMTSPGFAGLGFVAFTIGMTAGRFGGDMARTYLGGDMLFRVAIGFSAVGLAGAGLGPNRWVILASYAVAGLGIATFFPKLYDDAAQYRGRRGAGLGWLTAGSRVAGLIVPALVGVLAATRLSVGAATAIVTLPCVIGFYVVTTLNSKRSGRS